MYGFFNLLDKTRRYFAFSPEELRNLVIAILLLGFMAGFNDGTETFDLVHWLRNLINVTLIITLAVLARETARRIAAFHFGHKVEFRIWWLGLGMAFLLSLISYGSIVVLIYGGMVVSMMPKHRLGYFRYGLSYNDMAGMAFAAVLANLGLALLFRLFVGSSGLAEKAITINALFAVYNILPIPPLDGSAILYAQRAGYIFTLALVIAVALLIMFAPIVVTLIGSLVFAGLAALLFIWFVDLK